MELDILSRVKGVDKLAVEKAVMEVKQLSIAPRENLIAKVKALEEENARLRRELEKLRKTAPEQSLSPMEEKRIREWVSNLKSRLGAFADIATRRKLLKLLVSIDEEKEFFPEWIANEIGVSAGCARKYLKQLNLLFRVGIVTLDGKKLTTSLVESRTVRRRVVYRNNIREYVRVCLNMIVPGLSEAKVKSVLNEVFSYIYNL
ncbi:MAG: hypothetical protein JRC86_01475 [Deltaproteobacteria bacterium]|nr:hypothetical protein [Deltaproteobacteria bacterium]